MQQVDMCREKLRVAVSVWSWELDSVRSETSECDVYGCLLLYVIPYIYIYFDNPANALAR